MSFYFNHLARLVRAGILLTGVILAPIAAAQSAVALDHRHTAVQAVMALQAEVGAGLMSTPAILGTAVGVDASSQPVLVIFVDQENAGMAAAIRSIPPQMRGVGTQIELTEKFRAFAPPPKGTTSGGGVSHKARQTPPISLGTSGGWRNDLANGYCCGGTLGALVWVNGAKHILSNYHVFEADTVAGGNQVTAETGAAIIQPALIDAYCDATITQTVASLVKKSSLPDSNVDCSIALVATGMVREDGAILGIGPISSQTATAVLNRGVKKSGRTTGLTRSSVSGLNATITVTYENECAGGVAFTKTFKGQIVIANRGTKFLAGGDSGSVMVEDVATKPRAVGLLFAGSSSTAIANPIDEVLSFLGASMVGN